MEARVFLFLQFLSISLEKILETELDNARIDGCSRNLPERLITPRSVGTRELWSIEGIVELSSELDSMAFFYHGILDNGNIPVKLAGTADNAYPGISISRAIAINPAGWQCAECIFVNVAGAAAYSAQSFMNAAGCRDGTMSSARTKLRPGTAGSINAVACAFREGQRNAGLDGGDSGDAPIIEEFSLCPLILPERQLILIVQNEAMRPIKSARSVLLILIQWIIGIRTVSRAKSSEAFAESIGCLQRQPIGIRFTQRGLKAMVIGSAVEIRSSQAGRLKPDMWHPQAYV